MTARSLKSKVFVMTKMITKEAPVHILDRISQMTNAELEEEIQKNHRMAMIYKTMIFLFLGLSFGFIGWSLFTYFVK